MIFLIQYDRSRAKLIELREFNDSQRIQAQDERLALELELHATGVQHEVVLLEAADEPALHETHRRYFESVQQLALRAGQ